MSRITILNATAEDFALEIVTEAPVNGSVGDHANGRIVKYGQHIYVWCNHQGIWAKFANASDFTSLETRLSQQEDARLASVTALAAVDTSLEARISEEEDAMASAVASEEVRAVSVETSLDSRISIEEASMTAALSSLQVRASTAEGVIEAAVASIEAHRVSEVVSLETRANSVETALNSRMLAEETGMTQERTDLTNALASAEASRIAGDNNVSSSLTAMSSDKASDDVSLETYIEAQEADLSAILAASSAPLDNFSSIVSLINHTSIEQSGELSTSLSTVAASVASMESHFTSEDNDLIELISIEEASHEASNEVLDSRMSIEISATASLDSSLTSRISDGEADRILKDASLTTMFTSIQTALISSDDDLDTNISTEISVAASLDASLEAFVNSAETALVSMDVVLENSIAAQESTQLVELASLEAARSSEDVADGLVVDSLEAARIAGDAALSLSADSLETALVAKDVELNSRIATEEATFASERSTIEANVSSMELNFTSVDGDFETSVEATISTQKSKVDAILADAGATDTFVELVTFINTFDVDADDQLASYETAIDSTMSVEESVEASAELSAIDHYSLMKSDRVSDVSSLEAHHSSEIASLETSVDSLETREGSRHLRVDFGGSAPVTSFTVSGSQFPAGFKMDEHGMVQVFQDIGSNKFRHLVTPVEVDMTSGDVTVQLGTTGKAGFAVFYMFADDEGAVTEVQNAYQMQMSTSSYDGDSSYYLATSVANAVGTAFPYEVHVKDYANATSFTSYGYTSWTINGPFNVGINWGNAGDTGAVLRWYTAQSTDGGTTWSASSYYDSAITIESSYAYASNDYFQMPSYDPSYDYPLQTLTEGALYKTWVEGYDANGALVLQAGSSSSPYYFADRSSFEAYPGMDSVYDPVTSTSTNYYWNSSNSYVTTTAQHGDTVDITVVNPSHSNYAPGESFSNAILSMNANSAASTYYGWNQDSTDWAVTGTDASVVDLSYDSGVQSTSTDASYLSVQLANNTIPAAGTYTFTITAQAEDTNGSSLSATTFNVTMIIS